MAIEMPFLPFLLTFFIFIAMVINVIMSKKKPSNSKKPPGPWKLPLIGNMHQLLGSSLMHHTLKDLAEKHGPLMYLKLGQCPTIVVSSPEIAKELLKTNDANFASRPPSLFAKIVLYDTKDFVFCHYGEYWRNLRKICVQEFLNTAKVKTFRPIREREMSKLVELVASSDPSSPINLSALIRSSSYAVISLSAFGKERKEREEFISIVDEAADLVVRFDPSELFPSMASFLLLISPLRRKLERLQKKADRILEKIIKDHIDENISGTKNCDKTEDLVDVLLKFNGSGDQLGFSVTMEGIKGVVWDIFSAGGETSATTTDWAMAEMIRNPGVMKKAQQEVRQVFRSSADVNEESIINKLSYLKCVAKEALRLHPPAPLLVPRESLEKCEVNGYEVAAKTRVLVNAWAIGRDPRFWTDPESFVPERFIDSPIDYKGNDFMYIPFGTGRRICPGISLGMINVMLMLAFLLYHFDWKLPDGNRYEDLDMSESNGLAVRRKDDLLLIPKVYDPSDFEETTRK